MSRSTRCRNPAKEWRKAAPQIAALTLAHRHFRRDVLLNFFLMQAEALREAGVHQWILTDWNTRWDAVADDPLAARSMDIAGLNDYQPRDDDPEFWMNFTWHQDMHRSAYGRTHFITTENRFGVIGGTHISDPSPTREQFLMWGLRSRGLRNLRAVLLDRQPLAGRPLAAMGRAARLVRPSRAGF